jgi:hypothetical protein
MKILVVFSLFRILSYHRRTAGCPRIEEDTVFDARELSEIDFLATKYVNKGAEPVWLHQVVSDSQPGADTNCLRVCSAYFIWSCSAISFAI